MDAVVISHRSAADRTTGEFLEEIRELLALSAPLALLAEKSHVLNAREDRRGNNLGVVPRDDFLRFSAPLGFELGDIIADDSAIAQELVDVAFVPHRLPCVPRRHAFFDEGADDDAAPIALHVHVEDAADELRALFEHVNLAIAHFEPPRDLARHDDAFFCVLALRLPVGQRPERLVLALAVRAHHVRQDREKRCVRRQVEYHVLCGEAYFDAVPGDLKQQHQCFVHTVAGQTVHGLGDEHRARRHFTALASLKKAAEFTGLGVVTAECGDTNVLHGFGHRQAVGFDESQCSVVLPAFAIAPGLAL